VILAGDRVARNMGARDGGGLHLDGCPSAVLERVVVDANIASHDGGGAWVQGTRLDLVACRITGNATGERGGGLRARGDSLRLVATVVAANRAAILGGGLALSECALEITNATLASNDGAASGLFLENAPTPGTLRNSIVAGNVRGGVAVSGGVPLVLDWNLFWQNGDLDRLGVEAGLHDLAADPLFAGAETLDFQLGLCSPALDSGDPAEAERDPDGSRNDRGAHGGPGAAPAAPARVAGLSAAGLGAEVRLAWSPSTAEDIASYIVFRATQVDFRPSAASFLAHVPAPETTWIDASPIAGARYVVVAVTARGHASGTSAPVQAAPPTDAGSRPPAFLLRPIAPNPANPGAWVTFDLPGPASVLVQIYSAQGRVVRSLGAAPYAAGTHRVHWDGRDAGGRSVASGVYWIRVATGSDHRTAKVVVVR
jgi:hypothetical protein